MNDLQNKIKALENIEEKFTPEDYKTVMSLIKELDDSYKILREHVNNNLKIRNLNESVLEAVLPYNINEVDTYDINELRELLANHEIRTRVHELTDEEVKDLFITVKENSNTLLSAKVDTEKIKKDSTNVLKEYYNYMSNNRVQEVREKRLATLKEQVENEEDPVTKSKMEKMIKTIEESFNFEFIKERLYKFRESEIKKIEEAFFSEKVGLYAFEKFEKKIQAFGYSKDVYKNFFNIEENLLPKNYSPFNNLFLFIYIRFVAYADTSSKNDKMYVQSLTTALSNLVYHKFENTESEEKFVEIIKSVDDFFMDDVEKFKTTNTTYEGHPVRIEAEKAHEANRREALIKALERIGVTDYDKDMEIDNLQEFYADHVEKLIEKQMNEQKEYEEAKKQKKLEESEYEDDEYEEEDDSDEDYEDEEGYDEEESESDEEEDTKSEENVKEDESEYEEGNDGSPM